MVDITCLLNPDVILTAIAAIMSLVAGIKTRDANKALSAGKSLLDLMNPEKPLTPDQEKLLETTPEIEKTYTMDTATKNTVFKILAKAKPTIKWDDLVHQIENIERQKKLSYVVTTGWDYANENESAAVFIDYGLIRASGTMRDMHNLSLKYNAVEIFV
ncbi:hypothetical protein [Methanocorpusculum vombati]|uniref:Uncharacterized protein n=1 Tax=Methanocorpusculum vombati TaxID=3002864 RepID=A0ABT4IMB9_9EURY|nr:hypothetical protein [Methanocorpusculum vombati]MCZ9319571.1 hypothetical protein [Methanocorpusculum sp.]MCZ0862260.1 hypothetical protein [Methanocorpusculum vombati]MDE2519740.1 hypothetical protein [Methanocorpusculum sp.]MDE2534480.1 hypothetical protein [Methanocorpusculum sp.]MDE2545201.1 hypothetical protein [Methanocorpusculum sp.]